MRLTPISGGFSDLSPRYISGNTKRARLKLGKVCFVITKIADSDGKEAYIVRVSEAGICTQERWLSDFNEVNSFIYNY